MAKKKKYPKTPKSTASLQVWENHQAKCREIDKENAKNKQDAIKKANLQKSVKAMKSKSK